MEPIACEGGQSHAALGVATHRPLGARGTPTPFCTGGTGRDGVRCGEACVFVVSYLRLRRLRRLAVSVRCIVCVYSRPRSFSRRLEAR